MIPMEPKFTFKLPRALANQTHVGVYEVIAHTDGSLGVTGELGKIRSGKWTRAELSAMNWNERISGEQFEDYIIQSEGRGRPVTKPAHEYSTVDLVAHLEEDPGNRQVRIKSRRPPSIEEVVS